MVMAPLLAPLAAIALAALAGLSQRSFLATPLEPYAYGFFLDRYPFFALAIVYGLARLVAVALREPGRLRPLRLLTLPLACAALLAACLHPTFGGFVIRTGFFAGGMSFLKGQTLVGAYLLGTALAALVFGAALGLGVALVRLRVAWSRRALLRGLGSFLALWWAALVIAAPRALGLAVAPDVPALPLGPADALAAAALALLAFAPHALLVSRRTTLAGLPTPANGGSILPQRAA
jgi:hypothetical protein